jgi:hypothetical protein
LQPSPSPWRRMCRPNDISEQFCTLFVLVSPLTSGKLSGDLSLSAIGDFAFPLWFSPRAITLTDTTELEPRI